MGLFGFIGDAIKTVVGGLSDLAGKLGLDKINAVFANFGGLAGVIAKLTSLSNPLTAFATLTDVFGALSNNKDKTSQGATSSAANGLLGTLSTLKKFGL